MRTININNIDRKSKSKKPNYVFVILLSMIGIFLYFFLTNKVPTVNAIQYLFSRKRSKISYETYDIYLDNLGETYMSQIKENLGNVKFEDKNRFNFVDDKESSDIVLGYGSGDSKIYSKYLLPVGYIYWINDSVSSNDLKYGEYTVLLNEADYDKYSGFLTSNYPDMKLESSTNLLKDLQDEDCGCVGLIENSELSKEYRLLKVDDKYYLDTFDSGVEVSIVTQANDDVDLDFVSNIIKINIGLTDTEFNKDTIAKVNMTGVTALARRVAEAMAVRNDYDYPAQKIATFLADADLTHTSNEISFVDGCTTYSGMRFCSSPKSIETLKAIGADLIELTGNHNNDFGSSNNTRTIEDYKEEGMAYFGGGLNTEDARKPYIVEIDGTKIAFIGYNYYDAIVAKGTNALAGVDKAGANPYSEENMREDIESVRDDVDIVIVDLQFQECYSYPSGDVIYPVCYKPISNQANTFRKAIDFGADIVVGTQAHQPQTYELYGDGVIFYGLGNLFFDQSMWIGTRQGMILTHYFKDGELIQTKITPTIYDSSLQVHVANDSDADLLLELLETARKSL